MPGAEPLASASAEPAKRLNRLGPKGGRCYDGDAVVLFGRYIGGRGPEEAVLHPACVGEAADDDSGRVDSPR